MNIYVKTEGFNFAMECVHSKILKNGADISSDGGAGALRDMETGKVLKRKFIKLR